MIPCLEIVMGYIGTLIMTLLATSADPVSETFATWGRVRVWGQEPQAM